MHQLMDDSRYKIAIIRNLDKIVQTISYRNALDELGRVAPYTNWSFFSYAYISMLDGMISSTIKVLDKQRDAASFYYLLKCNKKQVEDILSKTPLTIVEIEDLHSKLIDIRDKTHFHLDKKDIFSPENVWKRNKLDGDAFNKVIDNLFQVLRKLYFKIYENESLAFPYKGQDIEQIIKAVKEKGLDV